MAKRASGGWSRRVVGAITTMALVVLLPIRVAAQSRLADGPVSGVSLDAGRAATPKAAGADLDAGREIGMSADASGRDAGTSAPPKFPPAASATATLLGGPVPTFRPRSPPLPPPTPQQVEAFRAMRQEAEAYEHGALDYKDTITTIITLHYEEKKKAILGGLDREVGIEKVELKKSRETAIKRLEDFVARYSGPNSQPEATPDAMYRLAALYEERARSDDDPNADAAITLKPAIALYKRVVREFPNYSELAGIYYFLGHALNDAR